MAEALIRGLLRSNLVRSYEMLASARTLRRIKFLEKTYGVHTTRDNKSVISACDTIILSIKPQDMRTVGEEIKSCLSKNHLLISIAAGIDFAKLREICGPSPKLIRVMPNLPVVIDEGISAIYCGPRISERYRRFAHQIFQAVGNTVDIKNEKLMDVITGLSGTGPAYFFALMEALECAGTKLGLDPQISKMLTLQTAVGAAKMVKQTGATPKQLRERVTSKKGTTQAAMNHFKKKQFWKIVEEAVEAATGRAKELCGEVKKPRPQNRR